MPGDVIMVPSLGAAKTAEILLGHVGASAIEAVGAAMVDPLHLEVGVKVIPRGRGVGMEHGALGDASLDEAERRALRLEDGRDAVAVALADDDDGLPLAVLVDAVTAIDALSCP